LYIVQVKTMRTIAGLTALYLLVILFGFAHEAISSRSITTALRAWKITITKYTVLYLVMATSLYTLLYFNISTE